MRSWKAAYTWELGWWMDATTVMACSRARDSSSSTTSRAVEESSPEVGSSKQSTLGEVSNSWAMQTRFLSPPDTPRFIASPMRVSAHLSSRRILMTSSTRLRIFSRGHSCGSRSCAEMDRDCRTVRLEYTMSSCSTNPTWRFRALLQTQPSCPNRTEPFVIIPLPDKEFKRVLFPDPVLPMRANIFPCSAFPETPVNAITFPPLNST
mmetsp:Transcript_6036/g.8169  ORF Transcript_6036/g.8169 Transcript_6036/m.8169 type:complete len:207 (+) Transcript_6036:1453-2073(+)